MNLFMQILTIVAASLMSAMGAFRHCESLLDWRAAMPGPLGARHHQGTGMRLRGFPARRTAYQKKGRLVAASRP
jgi:hypothetical protein